MKKLSSFWLLATFTAVRIYATPAPISVWSAENNANDSAGSNHGTLNNGASFATGYSGQAFSFDAIDDYITVPDSASLDYPSVSKAVTLAAWVKWNGGSMPDYHPIARKNAANTGSNAAPWCTYSLGIQNNGAATFSISDGVAGGLSANVISTAAITTGAWHHVAGTYDGSTLKVYIDGVLSASLSSSINIGNREGPFIIGRDSPLGGNKFNGLIDELELYDQALSPSQILTITGN